MTAADAQPQPRIVSLIASSTEILCALGLRRHIVGRSHECDYPPGIRDLPCCTEARVDASRPSLDIDRSVRSMLENALSLYKVDPEVLARLRPDVIVTQTQCEVCAVSLGDVEGGLAEWTGKRPRLVSLHGESLSGVWDDIRNVAQALGVPKAGTSLVDSLNVRMGEIASLIRGQVRKRVVCIEWIEPLMSAGNWMPELVSLAGGESLFGSAGRHSPFVEWSDIRAADPDIVLVFPCGFDLERTRREAQALRQNPGWESLRAVRESQVYLCDGNALFNRPGPRLLQTLEVIAEILHPEICRFGHRRSAYEVFAAPQ